MNTPRQGWPPGGFACLALVLATSLEPVSAAPPDSPPPRAAPSGHYSLADDRVEWPSWDQLARTVALRDYNTRIVLLGTTLLGISASLVGVFMLLRRRSLLGDVVSHSTLPGIAIAFLVLESLWPGQGKWLPGLLLGALAAGLFGILCTKLILLFTRVKEDAALAIVLSVFFGFGIALFTAVQNIPTAQAAGLGHFILGKAASMVATDVWLIAAAAAVIGLVLCLLFKEFTLLCFDERFAAAQGWPVGWLDMTLMLLVASVTVIGLQSVGLLLIVALLIIPPASARFWTNQLATTAWVAAFIGGWSASSGVLISALFPRLAAGAVIVLTGAACFLVSLLFGRRHGALLRLAAHGRLQHSVGRHHILRALFEYLEPECDSAGGDLVEQLTSRVVTTAQLLPMRSWSPARLRKLLRWAEQANLVAQVREHGYRLTERGAGLAYRAVRNHRLWELYLVEHADIAPSHVDRDADDIEHILGPEVVQGLEKLLSERYPRMTIPPSPHVIEAGTS